VLILVGHGSRSASADDVLPYYVDALKITGRFAEVRACFLEQEPRIGSAFDGLAADRVFVMPFLIAHGFHTRVTIPEALGISSACCMVKGMEVFYLEPLGRSDLIAQLIGQRVDEAANKY
jgi:sirohydrochlorin cobaltochelatase